MDENRTVANFPDLCKGTHMVEMHMGDNDQLNTVWRDPHSGQAAEEFALLMPISAINKNTSAYSGENGMSFRSIPTPWSGGLRHP